MQDMMKEVETDFIFIKADQVKYTKVILHMGGFRYEHATYNLQLFQKIWYSTAPFLGRPQQAGDYKESLNSWQCQEFLSSTLTNEYLVY